jgi:hypothetical protein
MRLQCKYTAEDYIQGYKTYARRGPRRWATRFCWAMAILVFLIGLLGSFGPKASFWSALPLFLLAAFWVYYANAVWSRAGRRAFSGRPELAQEYTIEADESGVVFSGAISRMQWSWAAFIKFAESKKLFLTYLSPCVFVILPKRILSPGETDQLRELLRQKLPNG